jgi:very-short-patch-repair endonuclease
MEANKENFYAYNAKLQPFANKLRKSMTKAEACLWKYALRAGKCRGYGFRRQRPVLNFIADFMCKELMLVIEVDGITHTWEETIKKDKTKDEKLKAAGFRVLRFKDDDVLKRINWVIESIVLVIEEIENKAKEPTKKRTERKPKRKTPPPTPASLAGDSASDNTIS